MRHVNRGLRAPVPLLEPRAPLLPSVWEERQCAPPALQGTVAQAMMTRPLFVLMGTSPRAVLLPALSARLAITAPPKPQALKPLVLLAPSVLPEPPPVLLALLVPDVPVA